MNNTNKNFELDEYENSFVKKIEDAFRASGIKFERLNAYPTLETNEDIIGWVIDGKILRVDSFMLDDLLE